MSLIKQRTGFPEAIASDRDPRRTVKTAAQKLDSRQKSRFLQHRFEL
jgi:hypothetical protein